MSSFLTQLLGEKREWTAMEERARVLPRDERLRGTTSYLDKWLASLDRDVAKKLGE